MRPSNAWMKRATCVIERTPDWVFDSTEYQNAKDALNTCALCPVRLECLRWVDPAENFFDGTCGGVVWRDGRVFKAHPRNFPPLYQIGMKDAEVYFAERASHVRRRALRWVTTATS